MKSVKGLAIVAALCSSTSLYAQVATVGGSPSQESGDASEANSGGEIIVTAQKRSERLSDVPMSITAGTAEQLRAVGIATTDDLAKIVPGFTFVKGIYGLPVYFIRGVGFNDVTLGVSPAVTVYTDQVPLPYSPMSRGATLDLERVEILKGPQGTLFGQNSTGGAINYIAAKPTDHFEAGFDLGIGRFNSVDTEAFISGPITDTLRARLAVRHEYQDDWQKSYVNNDTIGRKKFINGRASLDWEPSSTFRVSLTASAWKDTSDVQQPQFIAARGSDFSAEHLPVGYPIESFPVAPNNARAAAWDPGVSFSRNDRFYQFAGRADWDLTDAITLTSLTSYAHYETDTPIDYDGSTYPMSRATTSGTIKNFSQELRLSGEIAGSLRWMFGGNYQKDRVTEEWLADRLDVTANNVGPYRFYGFGISNDQKVKTASVFGSLDYELTDKLTLQGSLRYTDQKRDFAGCNHDDGSGQSAAAMAFLSFLITGQTTTIAPGGCTTINTQTGLPGLIVNKLDEDNLSWRVGVDYKPAPNALVYANVTKGYKSGSFPTVPGAFSNSLAPIGQESVLAYEIGTKLDLFDRKVQITGAAFYYDYRDKQLLGNLSVPPFGSTPALVSIPKSKVQGAELSTRILPFDGLTINLGGTYVDTKLRSDPPNPTGPYGTIGGSFVGQPFPFTPKWQGVADVQYSFPVSSGLNAFLGGNVTARSKAFTSLFNGGSIVSPFDGVPIADLEKLHVIPGYALVDLRAGVETPDGLIRLEAWGRNVGNKYYLTNVVRNSDYIFRYAGMPATYGVTLRYRFGR